MKSSGAEVDFGAIDRGRLVDLVRTIEAAIDEHEPSVAEVITALITVLSRGVRNVECDLCRGLAAITARDSLSDSLAEMITEYDGLLGGDESDEHEHTH
jgi:hypothetical protein